MTSMFNCTLPLMPRFVVWHPCLPVPYPSCLALLYGTHVYLCLTHYASLYDMTPMFTCTLPHMFRFLILYPCLNIPNTIDISLLHDSHVYLFECNFTCIGHYGCDRHTIDTYAWIGPSYIMYLTRIAFVHLVIGESPLFVMYTQLLMPSRGVTRFSERPFVLYCTTYI